MRDPGGWIRVTPYLPPRQLLTLTVTLVTLIRHLLGLEKSNSTSTSTSEQAPTRSVLHPPGTELVDQGHQSHGPRNHKRPSRLRCDSDARSGSRRSHQSHRCRRRRGPTGTSSSAV